MRAADHILDIDRQPANLVDESSTKAISRGFCWMKDSLTARYLRGESRSRSQSNVARPRSDASNCACVGT